MRVGNLNASRLARYDRNWTIVVRHYDATYGPGGEFQEWNYLVPANRKAVLLAAHVGQRRDSRPAYAGVARGWITVNPGTATADRTVLLRADLHTMVVNASVHASLGECGEYPAGTLFEGRDDDGSVGGGIQSMLDAAFGEFDA